MAGIWVVGTVGPSGALTRLSAEVATLARNLGEAGAGEVTGIVVGPDPSAAAGELARYVARVLAVSEPAAADHASATLVG